jgi:hypothetical protein
LKTGKPVKYSNEYSDPKNHIFRDEKEIEIGMKDFELRVGKINIENPHGISVFEKRPRFLIEKEKEKSLKKERSSSAFSRNWLKSMAKTRRQNSSALERTMKVWKPGLTLK